MEVDKPKKSEYEKKLIIEWTSYILEVEDKTKLVGTYCSNGRKFADVEFIDTSEDTYYVLEAKIPYTTDRPNTKHKLIGQLLAECDKDLRVASALATGKKGKLEVSQERATYSGKIKYGALFIAEAFSDMVWSEVTLPSPKYPDCNGIDYYSAYYRRMERSFVSFGDKFGIESVFIVSLIDQTLYRVAWSVFPTIRQTNYKDVAEVYARCVPIV